MTTLHRPRELDASTANLARKLAPVLMLDSGEPFAPDTVGVTRLSVGEPSPSCPQIPTAPNGTSCVLEFAIWWAGDTPHNYDLEHIWIAVDTDGNGLFVSASAHGGVVDLPDAEWTDGRPAIYCVPGKRMFASTPDAIKALRNICSSGEGIAGILLNDMFAAQLSFVTPYDQFLAREYLRSLRPTPTFEFTRAAHLKEARFVSWDELALEIPRIIRDHCEDLRRRRRGLKAVFLDSGDTLINEMTEVFDPHHDGLVLSADPIDGALDLMDALRGRVPTALVADGRVKSFRNVHGALGFYDHFDARAISETVGVTKPHPLMFIDAMRKLGLRREDASGILMVGNNLHRDIRGARRLGIGTVWLNWNDRYDRTPQDPMDEADHEVRTPREVLALIESELATSGFSD